MRHLIIVLILLQSHLIVMAQDTPGSTFGGPYDDIGYALCNANDGGFILAGTTRNSSSSSDDIYIVKIDKNGNHMWDIVYGWPHTDVVRSVIPLNDGYLFVGDAWDYGLYDSDIYLLKTDLSGNKVWDNLYGTNSRDIGFKAISSVNGGYFILGHTRGYDNAGDIILIKTNETGEEIWRNTYGSEFDDYGLDLTQCDDGTILITGTRGGFYNDVHANFKNHDADIYLILVDQDGNMIWEKTIGGTEHDFGSSLLKSRNGDIYILGSSQSYGAGSFDLLLSRTDDQGEVLWQKTYGGTKYDYGQSLAINIQHKIFLLGTTQSFGTNNSADIYVLKTDESGNEIWSLTIGGEGDEFGYQVVATADSGCMIIGNTDSFGEGMSDFLITKIDKNGIIEYFLDSIEIIYNQDMLIYPMPVRQQGKVRFRKQQATDLIMTIVSLSGNQITSYPIHPPDFNFKVYDITPGLYLYQIRTADNAVIYKGKLAIQ